MTVRFHRLVVGVLMCVLVHTQREKVEKLSARGRGEYIKVEGILGKAVQSDNFNTL